MRTDRPAMPLPPEIPPDMPRQVAAALQEDVGSGDVTAGLIPSSQAVTGEVICRDAAVICGAPWVGETYRQLDPRVALEWRVAEGERVEPAGTVLRIEGPARPVLTGERTALNFLQLLSGTATAARRFADAVAGTGCTILDTRKTLPGLRTAQKYAVRCGGARNHRMGLYDMILIKENHIAAAGSLGAAVAAARAAGAGLPVEVEVESLAELEEALAAGPDIVMLDDFTLQDMRTAVERVHGGRRPDGRSPATRAGHRMPVKLEASGSANLESVRGIAETGVDFVSVGALTKHVRAVDLSMRLTFTPPRT